MDPMGMYMFLITLHDDPQSHAFSIVFLQTEPRDLPRASILFSQRFYQRKCWSSCFMVISIDIFHRNSWSRCLQDWPSQIVLGWFLGRDFLRPSKKYCNPEAGQRHSSPIGVALNSSHNCQEVGAHVEPPQWHFEASPRCLPWKVKYLMALTKPRIGWFDINIDFLLPYLSLFILIYPYLFLFILIYPYLSLFILIYIYPYLSLFILIYPYFIQWAFWSIPQFLTKENWLSYCTWELFACSMSICTNEQFDPETCRRGAESVFVWERVPSSVIKRGNWKIIFSWMFLLRLFLKWYWWDNHQNHIYTDHKICKSGWWFWSEDHTNPPEILHKPAISGGFTMFKPEGSYWPGPC